MNADTDLEAEVDPSVETEEKLQAEEIAAKQRLEAMQRSVSCPCQLLVRFILVAEEVKRYIACICLGRKPSAVIEILLVSI